MRSSGAGILDRPLLAMVVIIMRVAAVITDAVTAPASGTTAVPAGRAGVRIIIGAVPAAVPAGGRRTRRRTGRWTRRRAGKRTRRGTGRRAAGGVAGGTTAAIPSGDNRSAAIRP